jgi:hypothetical protein
MLRIDKNGVPTIQSSIPMSLFALGLVLTLALAPMDLKSYFYPAFYSAYEDGSPAPSDWRQLAIVIGIGWLAYYVWVAATAFFYFQRQRIAQSLVMSQIVVALIVTLVETAWACGLADGDTEYMARQIGPAVYTTIIACAWLTYFAISKQVRAVLAYPLPVDGTAPSVGRGS